jgi:hypothetical protein
LTAQLIRVPRLRARRTQVVFNTRSDTREIRLKARIVEVIAVCVGIGQFLRVEGRTLELIQLPHQESELRVFHGNIGRLRRPTDCEPRNEHHEPFRGIGPHRPFSRYGARLAHYGPPHTWVGGVRVRICYQRRRKKSERKDARISAEEVLERMALT